MSDLSDFCSCDITTYPYFERRHTARKTYQCYDCCGPITKGERYLSVGGLCEGEWWNGKLCQRCEAMLDWVKAHVPCACPSFGNMREELTELCQEASRQAPGLLFGFYRRVIAIDRHNSHARSASADLSK